jgi:hypothetical protein
MCERFVNVALVAVAGAGEYYSGDIESQSRGIIIYHSLALPAPRRGLGGAVGSGCRLSRETFGSGVA